MLKLALEILIAISGIACQENILKEWLEKVGSVLFECETLSNLNKEYLKNQVQIVEIVECDHANANLNYEFKVS